MSTLAGKRFGFLGAGVIAEVFIRRLIASGTVKPEQILASDINTPIRMRLATSTGIQAMDSNGEVVAGSDFVFLAAPPLAVVPVLKEVSPVLRSDQMIFSLAAAVSTELIEAAIGKPIPVVRVIPNTPSWIGQGMNPFCVGSHLGPSEKVAARQILAIFGQATQVPEEQMAIATALTAVGPTYIFPVIAALSDAAITHGLPPRLALSAACQLVAGAANLVREAGRSPEGLSLMISTRTLDEAAARKLFTQAVGDAHGKILGAEARVTAAAKTA